jgi:hypothetical protein
MTTYQALGALMIASVFVGIFIMAARLLGVATATSIFVAALAIVCWLAVGVHFLKMTS